MFEKLTTTMLMLIAIRYEMISFAMICCGRTGYHLLFLFLVLLPLRSGELYECTNNKACKCNIVYHNFFRADCSNKDLTTIPSFNDNVIDIDLSGNALESVAARNTFPRQLLKLDLSSCKLRSIELGALEKLKNISHLDISRNTELTLNVLPNITNDLIGSEIKSLKFSAIQCPDGPRQTLKYEHLCRLQNTSLTLMELSHNRIDMIEPFTIRTLSKSLINISAGHNQLRFGWYLFEMLSLQNLNFINVSDMYSSENPFKNPWILSCDDQNKENPNQLPKQLIQCPKVTSPRNLEYFDKKFIMHMPPNLETLVINNCIIRETELSKDSQLKFKSLKVVYANNNFLPHYPDIDHSNSLQQAYFSRCFINQFDDSFFLTSNLTVLDLSYNNLYQYFSSSKGRHLLQKQKYLTSLNFSNNRFEHVPYDLFQTLTRLNALNMKENELSGIDFSLTGLTRLEILDLSGNRIRTLTKSNMNELDILSQDSSLSLNLTGNDLLCSCETLEFLRWMAKKQRIHSKLKLINFKKYSCSFVNSTKMKLSEISKIILELEKVCSTKSVYIIVSICTVIIFICCVVCGIMYRHRWKLRYIYHMTRRSLRGYFTLQNAEGVARKYFEFDAFISYAEEDVGFSYDMLNFEILKRRPSAKLCYHKEQFLPGSNIAENIVNAVHCSRKTVCVLSKHFMASEWCIYEFNMANTEKIFNRGDQNSLLILMLGDIKSKDIPATMMVYLQSNCYLEIPDKIDDSDMFWNRVYNAIMEE